MIRSLVLTSLLSVAHCWIEQRSTLRNPQNLVLLNHLADENFNPCWQDLYDDDCSMDTIYQSSFVASEWLKTMPCAANIADCDIPEELKLPGNKHENGMDHIDILKALNIKRAKGLSVEKNDKFKP